MLSVWLLRCLGLHICGTCTVILSACIPACHFWFAGNLTAVLASGHKLYFQSLHAFACDIQDHTLSYGTRKSKHSATHIIINWGRKDNTVLINLLNILPIWVQLPYRVLWALSDVFPEYRARRKFWVQLGKDPQII